MSSNAVSRVVVAMDGPSGSGKSSTARGVATRLVAEAERLLRDQGVRRMHLIASRAGGETAESFWISARYEPTDQLRFVKDL